MIKTPTATLPHRADASLLGKQEAFLRSSHQLFFFCDQRLHGLVGIIVAQDNNGPSQSGVHIEFCCDAATSPIMPDDTLAVDQAITQAIGILIALMIGKQGSFDLASH